MKVHLVSLGCARNLVDSEGMLGRLAAAGWQVVDEPDTAELIVVNTCSFIEPAADESIDTILELSEYKKAGTCRSLIVAGCLPERYGEAIAEELPEVDRFLGTGAYDRIVDAAEGLLKDSRCILPDPDGLPASAQNVTRVRSTAHTAYLKVAEGCSRHCTYCIIPKLRGKRKSRPPEDILSEARTLIDEGVRELVLVAQDTTDYGRDLSPDIGLADLLADLADLSPNVWIRLLYGHPESLNEATILTIAERPNICSYYDLPIQHASDPVLQRMGRRHPQAHLRKLFQAIRFMDPAAVLRTTVIVGFPGETEQDFQELMRFIEQIRFDHLGVFTYSDAEDLPSHRLPDPVSAKTADKRRDRLMERQREISESIHQKYLDRVLPVLVEESPEPNIFTGRTAFQAPEVDGIVYIHGETRIGEFVQVRITDTLEYDLVGDIVP
ncbi:MAG: 30S ribosomal protein S12 methylthiotransferase RimO [Thermodesulfobacteriota bacterium]